MWLQTHDGETGVTTVYTSTQLPHLVRRGIADALGADEASIRVIVPDVGGGFGLKANLYAEEIARRRSGTAPRRSRSLDRGPHREPPRQHPCA